MIDKDYLFSEIGRAKTETHSQSLGSALKTMDAWLQDIDKRLDVLEKRNRDIDNLY